MNKKEWNEQMDFLEQMMLYWWNIPLRRDEYHQRLIILRNSKPEE